MGWINKNFSGWSKIESQCLLHHSKILINNAAMLDVLKKSWIDDIVVLAVAFLPSEKMLPDRFTTAFVFKFWKKPLTLNSNTTRYSKRVYQNTWTTILLHKVNWKNTHLIYFLGTLSDRSTRTTENFSDLKTNVFPMPYLLDSCNY